MALLAGWLRAAVCLAYASLVHASLIPTVPPSSGLVPGAQKPVAKRQRDDDRCGRNFGGASCASDECCSAEGWCGKGYLYCSGPACQINYGPACDANIRPRGADTERTPRPAKGRVPYGEAIYACRRPGIALTYDDGPYEHTDHLLSLLKEYGVHATFFISGNSLGKGAVNDASRPWRALLARMLADGHQVASHTYTHQRLTELSRPQLRRQMLFNEIAIADALGGRFPTYMRPPYSASNANTDRWLAELGYHVTYFNLDTEGYLHNSPADIAVSKRIWDAAVDGRDPAALSYLHIEHDIVYQTVYNLTGHMLASMRRNAIRGLTVGECLDDPRENWYRYISDGGGGGGGGSGHGDDDQDGDGDGDGSPELPPTRDGRCGASFGGQTCAGERGATCCSGKGWCGSSTDHCGQACQPVYGTCA